MSLVRPFPGRVVRPDAATSAVTALSEPVEESSAAVQAAPDPAAYDQMPATVYVYEQDGHLGLVCEVATRAFVDGGARGHEAVQTQRVETLVRHLESSTEPPALVALLHRAGPVFTRVTGELRRTPPLVDFAGPDGLRQTVWPVPEPTELLAELSTADLYVADGHHRVAAALTAWRRQGEPADAGVLCVVHPLDGLRLSAFHRRIGGPTDRATLIGLLGEAEVRDAADAVRPEPGSFGLYVGHAWHVVRPVAAGAARLDVAVLQTQVLDRLDAAHAVEIAPARMSVAELTARCDADGGALFTLAPPPLDVLTGLADAGEVMPPKTTYFAPKPCTGIFLRP